MKRLQLWFDLLAGISQEERERYALARKIYGAPGPDLLAQQTPACWRRKSRIRISNT